MITTLDAAVLGSDAAVPEVSPAGLLANASDLGATAGGDTTAMLGDLGKITDAVATAGLNGENLMLVAHPTQAMRLRGLLTGPAFANTYTVVGTPALASATIVGVAPDAVAFGVFGDPEVEVVRDGAVMLDDTTPLDIGAAVGAGGTVKSLWQANLIAVRLRLYACWGLLNDNAVQLVESCTW